MEIFFLKVQDTLPNKCSFTKDPLTSTLCTKPYAIDFSDELGEAYFWECSECDNDTIKYIKLLECDKDFENKIKQIRKKFNLPIDGYEPWAMTPYMIPFTAEKSWKEQSEIIQNFYREIQKECLEVFKSYRIPFSLKLSFPDIVMKNYVNISSAYKFKFEKNDDGFIPKVSITIDLYSPMSSNNKIKKDLDEYWPEILKSLLTDAETYTKLPSLSDIEIWNIRNRLQWSYKKIATVINKRHHLNLDESEVRKRMGYIKKQYKKITPE